jgi:PAS domain S-box-containing protein
MANLYQMANASLQVAEIDRRTIGEELFKATVRHAPYFIGICDDQWRPVFINSAGRRMVGLGEDVDVSTLAITDFFEKRDRQVIGDVALPTLMRTGSWEGEYRFLHFGGGTGALVHWRAFLLRDEAGRHVGAATITTDITARKEAEARLWESEARLQAAVGVAGLSSYRWIPATGELHWDKRLKAIWGLPEDASVDQDIWIKGIHPDDRARVAAASERSVDPDHDGTYIMEYRVVGLSDGAERWVSVKAQTFFEGREPVQHIGAVLDITAQKRAEERLRRSEAYLSAILQQLPIGVGVFDDGGHLELANETFRLYVSKDLPSHSVKEAERWRSYRDGSLVSSRDYPGARALRRQVTIPGMEFLHNLPDGRAIWTSVGAVPLRDDAGSVTGAITTIQNIDKEKRAVAALRASEERFRRFAENSGDVLWIYDAEKKAFDYISPAYGRIWGRPVEVRNSFLSRWVDTVHPEDRDLVTAALDRIASLGDTVSQSFRILRPDGAVRWIDATGFPIHDGENGVHSIGGIARDVTRHDDPTIYVIDADPRTCRARTILLKDLGHRVVSFNSEAAFLNAAPALSLGCVIVRSTDLSGQEFGFAKLMKYRRTELPVIFEIPIGEDYTVAVRAMKAGAADVVDAPCSREALFAAVTSVLSSVSAISSADSSSAWSKQQIAILSPRERDVLNWLIAGYTNKMIARELGISPRTVEVHRASVMNRLGAHTLPELVLRAADAGLRPPSAG